MKNNPGELGAKGHDAPVEDRALDDYDRWPVASAISNVISASPAEWSTRVGLYGAWGDGKTTVLRFLARQQQEAGNIVVQYSPWGATTEEAVWTSFASTLRAGLRKAGITLGWSAPLRYYPKKWWSQIELSLRGGARVIDATAGMPVASALTDTTASIVRKLFGFKKSDIDNLVRQVGNRRVVVFVDDLDRTDPAVVPRLLLALRELLDLPTFVFVLAFDKRVVSAALQQYSGAWGKYGDAFLEKIIDFPITLPPPEGRHIRALARRYFGELNDFFPQEVLDDVLEVLPANPRRLKLLARTVASLGHEARRHEPGELDWPTILIFQILRLENEEFTRKLIERMASDQVHEWDLADIFENDEGDDHQKDGFVRLVNECFPDEQDERRERVRRLFDEWKGKRRFYPGERLRYQVSFGDRPHHLTWGEFKKTFALWRQEPRGGAFDALVHRQAERLDSTRAAAAEECLATAIGHYGALLEQAAESYTKDEQETIVASAADVLTLSDQLFRRGVADVAPEQMQNVEIVTHLWNIANQWIHFRANPGDMDLRTREAELVIEWAARLPDPMLLFRAVEPWSNRNILDEAKIAELRKVLRDRLLEILWPKVINEVLSRFRKERGISEVLHSQEEHNFHLWFVLAAPSSRLYEAAARKRLLDILREAPESSVVHENAIYYLRLLLLALDKGGRYCSDEKRIVFLREHLDLAIGVWRAVVSRESQYRVLQSLREARQKLVAAGVPEGSLEVPEWLQ